ncbi:methylated-DNA--[protein]-cysteine S-methyltransferase [Virgibacillus sp. W0181]|uniref:methylated-DNA--[protein]-cysteine S-methyltransferase n=1 Tax=Virgibacillus sp. W0181 TaxID=3391581 RepID=UPI003F479F9E
MATVDKKLLYWTTFNHNQWELHVAATENGLCYVSLPNESFDKFEKWARKYAPDYKLQASNQYLQANIKELKRYLDGEELNFSILVDLRGTPFQQSVWKTLKEIPYGETCTYSQIADQIGKPKAVRAVGSAIGANPLPIVIPCHRVIGKNGTLTGYRGGLDMKKHLLKLETQTVPSPNAFV